MQDSAQRHHIKPRQLRIFFATFFLISSVLNSEQAVEWAAHSPELNPLNYSVWDIWQELVYEGLHELYASLHKLEVWSKKRKH